MAMRSGPLLEANAALLAPLALDLAPRPMKRSRSLRLLPNRLGTDSSALADSAAGSSGKKMLLMNVMEE